MEESSLNDQSDMLGKIRQFVAEELDPISLKVDLEGDFWVLNGTKQFITNGDCASVFTTIAVTDEQKRARGGFTAFVIEKDFAGFSVSPSDKKMGLKGSHSNEIVFRNCRVPKENVISGMDMVGMGFKTAMRVLDKIVLHRNGQPNR